MAAVCACSAFNQTLAPHPNFFSLEGDAAAIKALPPARAVPATAPTLAVTPPYATAGFDSQRMMYVRHAQTLEYFAHNEWIDTPSRMLAPLIVASAERSGAFRAVVPVPSTASGDLRLDTQVRMLQQEFLGTPSRVRFMLRAYIVDNATRRVLASREFEAVVPAPTEDAQGGALAAHQAVRAVLEDLAAFCALTVQAWRP